MIRKQVKFTHKAKPAISNTENFIKAINSQNNITKYFTIKDLNSTFNGIDSPFSLFRLNTNLLSFHFDELESLIPKSKNDFQIIGISEKRLNKKCSCRWISGNTKLIVIHAQPLKIYL